MSNIDEEKEKLRSYYKNIRRNIMSDSAKKKVIPRYRKEY